MSDLRLDAEEEAAMLHLNAYMQQVKDWGLTANYEEMAAAIHVLQGFVTQHYLRRLAPEVWSDWYKGGRFG